MAKITVTCNRTILHNGEIFGSGSTLTDEENSLSQALESGAVSLTKEAKPEPDPVPESEPEPKKTTKKAKK